MSAEKIKKVILADVPTNGIIRYRGQWGVVYGGRGHGRRLHYVVDFWDAPRQAVRITEPVEWLTK